MPQRPRQQTNNRIGHHHRRQFAASQHKIANRKNVRRQSLLHTLVNALIMTTDKNDLLRPAQFLGRLLVKHPTGRAGNHHTCFRWLVALPQIRHRFKQRLRLHHHTGAAAIKLIIGQPMLGTGIITNIFDIQLQKFIFHGATDNALLHRRKHFRKKR